MAFSHHPREGMQRRSLLGYDSRGCSRAGGSGGGGGHWSVCVCVCVCVCVKKGGECHMMSTFTTRSREESDSVRQQIAVAQQGCYYSDVP
jgi:hypothetical protein